MALQVIILTGQSGSGKTTAIRTLEDRGFLCVDNLPVSLAEEVIATVEPTTQHLALVIDARQPHLLKDAPALVARLRQSSNSVRVVYLEALEEVLIRRFSETRRAHPLDQNEGLRRAIGRERELLAPMRELADDTIDTSSLSPHALRSKITHQIRGATSDTMSLAILSFGFKHGLPLDADMVFDVRFLPNPYFVETLRPLTGLAPKVSTYVIDSSLGAAYVERTHAFLTFLLPQFRHEGKRYLTLAFGCTGGQHRSVAIVQALAQRLRADGYTLNVRHRDIQGEESP